MKMCAKNSKYRDSYCQPLQITFIKMEKSYLKGII